MMNHSASWQLLQEDVDEDYLGDAGINRVCQEFWGLRYIDDAVIRRTYNSGDAGGDSDRVFSHLTDAQFSTIAVLDESAMIVERVGYDPYGHARHSWFGDVNGDDSVDTGDSDLIDGAMDKPIGDTDYDADADLNRDGVVDATDAAMIPAGGIKPLPAGWISNPLTTASEDVPAGPDNVLGYCGYVFNAEVELYTVRFRHYHPTLGRWIERDPAGYVDGPTLYVYARSSPSWLVDPDGRYSEDVHRYLTTWIAEHLPCFTPAEAKEIGDANQGVDDDPGTAPGLGLRWEFRWSPYGWGYVPVIDERQCRINRDYHALCPGNGIKDGKHGAGGNGPNLWKAATSGCQCDLKALGIYLHFLQDTFAHEGFENDLRGHLTGGHHPDHTSSNPARALAMVRATIDAMRDFLRICKPGCFKGRESEIQVLVQQMMPTLRRFTEASTGGDLLPWGHDLSPWELYLKRRILYPDLPPPPPMYDPEPNQPWLPGAGQ